MGAALIRARRRIQQEESVAVREDFRYRAGLNAALRVIDEESERAAEREFTRPLNGPEPVGEKP